MERAHEFRDASKEIGITRIEAVRPEDRAEDPGTQNYARGALSGVPALYRALKAPGDLRHVLVEESADGARECFIHPRESQVNDMLALLDEQGWHVTRVSG
jgi:hypothetical protein